MNTLQQHELPTDHGSEDLKQKLSCCSLTTSLCRTRYGSKASSPQSQDSRRKVQMQRLLQRGVSNFKYNTNEIVPSDNSVHAIQSSLIIQSRQSQLKLNKELLLIDKTKIFGKMCCVM